MKKSVPAAAAAILLTAAALVAVVPQKWTFRTADDFLRGKFDGISIYGGRRHDPRPARGEAPGAGRGFLPVVPDDPGRGAYLGTGHEGRIYKIAKDGKAELFSQTTEMDVTCLAVDRKGVLYAGTSPNGKIYKITAQGKPEEFFNPNEKYIWSLFAKEDGGFLAAVGESGGIYDIDAQGAGRMIFKAMENHVLCLKLDRNRDIIAGTGGTALVYRIGLGGKVSRDLRDAVRGGSDAGLRPGREHLRRGRRVADAGPEGGSSGRSADRPGNRGHGFGFRGRRPAGGRHGLPASLRSIAGQGPAELRLVGPRWGALFRIAPDGLAKRVWSSADEMIYSLFWNETDKRAVFGTGPKGRLYTADPDGNATLVIQSGSEQLFELVPVGVRTYILGNNPCSLSILNPDLRSGGEYTGPVLDARMISAWGRISWAADLPAGSVCRFQTRSGNSAEPGASWSDWSPPYQKGEGEADPQPESPFPPVQSPSPGALREDRPRPFPSRALLSPDERPAGRQPGRSPSGERVLLKLPENADVILGLESRKAEDPAKDDDPIRLMIGQRRVQRKGYQTIQWEAEDPNSDALSFTLSVRLEGEKIWRVLEEGWTETTYAFNTVNFPDGIYLFKVTASDAGSNPRPQALSGERTSRALIVDNTAPAVRNVQAVRESNGLNVSFMAEDAFLAIKEARYLVRPDEWRVVFPEDGIADSRAESYKFRVPLDARADGLLTIVVKDAAGNTAVVK